MDIDLYLKTINFESFRNPKVKEKYEKIINYLFANKFGSFSETDAKFIISYLAKTIIANLDNKERVKIKIQNKNSNETFTGSCTYDYDIFGTYQLITYTSGLVKQFQSHNYDDIVLAFSTTFHELIHVCQNVAMKSGIYTSIFYIMAEESVVRVADKEFYKNNYDHLLKEVHARTQGLRFALELLKKHNKYFYDDKSLQRIKDMYKAHQEMFFDSKLTILQETGNSIKQIDKIASRYMESNPKWVLKFPALQVAYNDDGTKKDLKTLLYERENLINDEEEMARKGSDIKEVNELYKVVINGRYFDATKDLEIITDYVKETKFVDEFILNLIKYRLKKAGFSNEDQEMLINSIENYVSENSKLNVK